MAKRQEYLDWDEYFMGIAILSGKRSKDPSTQVGACIVNEEHKIIGVGYNGFPRGIEDDNDDFSWEREGKFLDTKYPYVVHAELNAILNSIKNLKGCKLYVVLFPCNDCAKAIIQSGIKEVIYLSDKYMETDTDIAARRMFEATQVKFRRFIVKKEHKITIDFNVFK